MAAEGPLHRHGTKQEPACADNHQQFYTNKPASEVSTLAVNLSYKVLHN